MKPGSEEPILFDCQGDRLVGILHRPIQSPHAIGVVIVVGGPQYRVGSHRQFTLMARDLSAAGHGVFRFDHRGIGDSDGDPRTFETIGEDIRAAVDAFCTAEPSMSGIVLLGLCDAASAILMAQLNTEPVAGLLLVNPWVRTRESEAATHLKHYYGPRLRQRSFWRNLLRGQVDLVGSLLEYVAALKSSRRDRDAPPSAFVERMFDGLRNCGVPVLLITSGRDLVASEFLDLAAKRTEWRDALEGPQTARLHLVEADHTFSSRTDLRAATEGCASWLQSLSPMAANLP